MGDLRFVRFQAVEPSGSGNLTGVFGLVNGLSRAGRLTEEQESFRRTNADSDDPGRVVYEDADQVVVVPRSTAAVDR